MGVDGLVLGFEEDRDKEHKKRRKGLGVDGVDEIEGARGKRRKKKKDRRKGVEGTVDCVLGSEVGEGCGIEMSEPEIEESKNFDEKGSGVEVVDDGDRGKKKKKKEKEKGKNENNKNALISSTKEKSVALFDIRKRRGDGSDEPVSEDDGHSRDDGKKDMDGSGKVKKGKKHMSNDALVDNELRSVLSSAGTPANSTVETKVKVRREEREGKEKKKRNRYARDGDQSKNMSAQGKSEMFAILGENADDAHNDVKHKKKRKKGKQGRDDDCDTKYMVYGNDEFSDIGNENRQKLNTDKDNGENASLKADEDTYSYKKKKKKLKSDDSNSALEVADAGIVAVPIKKKVGEMEDQSIDNILCEEERSSVKEKKGKVVSFGEAASSAQLSGDCIESSSGEVQDGDFGACEGSKHSRKKKTERRESDKDKSDVQKKFMIKDEDAKRNGMDGIATDGKQREESNGHPKGKSHKRVSFSSEVQVFPPSDDGGEKQKLIIGKRFTKEEDELVKEAVLDYIGVCISLVCFLLLVKTSCLAGILCNRYITWVQMVWIWCLIVNIIQKLKVVGRKLVNAESTSSWILFVVFFSTFPNAFIH